MEAVKEKTEPRFWWRANGKAKTSCAVRLQPGDTCPQCAEGALEYDGLFLLTCTSCGHVAEGGAFT